MEVTAALTESWRRADIGAANGHGNASESVARIQAVVANQGHGRRCQPSPSPTTVERIFDQQSDAASTSSPAHSELRFGIGYVSYCPNQPRSSYIPDGHVCYLGRRLAAR